MTSEAPDPWDLETYWARLGRPVLSEEELTKRWKDAQRQVWASFLHEALKRIEVTIPIDSGT
jgi:hypothetical protein